MKLGPNPRKRKHGPKRSTGIRVTTTFPPETKLEIKEMLDFYSSPFNEMRSSCALSSASIRKLKQQILVFFQYLVTEKNLPSPKLCKCSKIKLAKDFVDFLLTNKEMGHSSIKNYLAALKHAVVYLAATNKRYGKKVKDSAILSRISNLSSQLRVS